MVVMFFSRLRLVVGVSGFSCVRVKGVGRGSLGFIVLCLVCVEIVFGLYVYSFWFESDRRGEISGLLSLDGVVFTCGRYDPPLPPLGILVK